MHVSNSAAQNTIYEVQGVSSTNSIIREFKRDKYVVYNDQSGVPTFGLANMSTGQYTEASISSPLSIVINDMEIVREYAYFCGKVINPTYAVYGFFHIDSVFSGSGDIHYSILSPITMVNSTNLSGAVEFFTDLLRIEPYVISKNDVHIFMVAVAYCVDTAGHTWNPYRCLIDAHYNGSATLDISALEDPNGTFYINDIAVTDNFLVVVGDKHGGTGDYMTYLPLPTIGMSIFFAYFLPPSIFYYWPPDIDYFPVPEVRIEALGRDAFATVCKGFIGGNVGTGVSGIVLSTYNSPISLNIRNRIDNPDSVKGFRDLKFNSYDNMIYYIPEFSLCNNPIHLHGSQVVSGYPTGTHLDNTVFAMRTACSLDVKRGVKGAFASGFSESGILNLWDVNMAESPCAAPNILPSVPSKDVESNYPFPFFQDIDPQNLTTIHPITNRFEIKTICR